MTRNSFSRRSSETTLRVETLESRRLLAVAAFATELIRDNDGVPGEVIVDNRLTAGETFYLRITAEEFDPLHSGIRGAAVNVDWDSGLLDVVEEDFDLDSILTDDYPLFRYGVLNNNSGSLHDLSAGAMLSWQAGRAIGDGTAETFAMIRMRAGSQAGEASIGLSKSRVKTIMVPTAVLGERHIDFDREMITIVPAIAEPSAEAQIDGSPEPVLPVVAERFSAAPETVTPTPNPTITPSRSPVTAAPASLPAVAPVGLRAASIAVDTNDAESIDEVMATEPVFSFDRNQDGVFDLGDFGLMNVQAEPAGSERVPQESGSHEESEHSGSVTSIENHLAFLPTCSALPEPTDVAASEAWLDQFAAAWIADADARQRRRAQLANANHE